jgi:aminopeptidase N
MKRFFVVAVLALTVFACKKEYPLPDKGVSLALNDYRKKSISDIEYKISLNIPEGKSAPIEGRETIEFNLSDVSQPLVIDFNTDSSKVKSVSVPYDYKNEHIIIHPDNLHEGKNSITIEFIAGDLSLNRNEDYLYTLFVPDRASTCLPLFDQPNLKATYQLQLQVPKDWKSVWNSLDKTKPISSYLFAFAAGKFKTITQDGMTMYYRETDSVKVKKNADEIFSLHKKSISWLEDYTGIKYPFDKFDFVLIPSFQYGGMEHPGSIFYNESSLFLDDNASVNRKMGRASLIAHETAHMWFGDLVTMNWFNDVWMKEVFANFMAAKIVQPSFPEIDHNLRFLLAHYPSAYSVDRTQGANPIIQPLDNLKNAGTMYGAIIYQKAPVVMRLLERKIGEDTMKESLREYLKTFSYNNAVWDDLVSIIDKRSPDDITAWSKEWVYTAGMPKHEVGEDFPNPDGIDYGYFEMSEENINKFFENYSTWEKPVFRASMLINIWEGMLHNDGLLPQDLFNKLEDVLKIEKNPLIVDFVLGEAETLYWNFLEVRQPEIEDVVWTLMLGTKDKGMKSSYFRAFRNLATTEKSIANLQKIWNGNLVIPDLTLSEEDKIALAQEITLKGTDVLNEQLELTKNPDRKERMKFVMPALSADEKIRDAFFESLKQEKNREHEAWVLEALSYLHHPLRGANSEKYLMPSLELLQEIQLTGDIFFPQRWLNTTFEGHSSNSALDVYKRFLEDHPNYPTYLKNKILQAVDMGERANTISSLETAHRD